MTVRRVLIIALGWFFGYALFILLGLLVVAGYADVAAGVLALLLAASGIWLSAKGMAHLKRPDNLSDNQLETAYRYRNAGIALGLTGSGSLVLSWETFLGRFISP